MKQSQKSRDCINPFLMYSRGVEQLVSDRIMNTRQYTDRELEALNRKEQEVNAKIFVPRLLLLVGKRIFIKRKIR